MKLGEGMVEGPRQEQSNQLEPPKKRLCGANKEETPGHNLTFVAKPSTLAEQASDMTAPKPITFTERRPVEEEKDVSAR